MLAYEQLHNGLPKCSKQVICNIQTWHDGHQPIGDVEIFIPVMATPAKQRLVIMVQLVMYQYRAVFLDQPVMYGTKSRPTGNVQDQNYGPTSKAGTSVHGPTSNVWDQNYGPTSEAGTSVHGPTGNIWNWKYDSTGKEGACDYGPVNNLQEWNTISSPRMGLVIDHHLLAHGPAGIAWPIQFPVNLSLVDIIVHWLALASPSFLGIWHIGWLVFDWNCYCMGSNLSTKN